MKLSCTECGAHLRIHCGNVNCDWWKCPTKGCDHELYDSGRGVLLHKDGVAEVL